MSDPRYHRQTILPEIGEAGQQRLASSRVLLVGCGALGCVSADLLVRAGVGHLTIVDRDLVERTNLQRQTLFDESDARHATPKADAAAARLRRVNSTVTVDAIVADATSTTIESIFDGTYAGLAASRPADLILDGTDNFLTRYLLNDLAVKRAVSLIYAGAVATNAVTMTIIPPVTPCLRCLFPDLHAGHAATCDTAGILAPVSSIIAATQALEAIKVLVGARDACSRDLLDMDPWRNRSRRVSLLNARAADCPCCVRREFEFLAGRHDAHVSVICTRTDGGAVQIHPARPLRATPSPRPSLEALATRLKPHGTFDASAHALRGVLVHETGEGDFPIELTLFADGRAVIRGTTDANLAKAIYARYVGE